MDVVNSYNKTNKCTNVNFKIIRGTFTQNLS